MANIRLQKYKKNRPQIMDLVPCLDSLTQEQLFELKISINPEKLLKEYGIPETKTIAITRGTQDYLTWRLDILRRDNYTCLNCGKIGGVLHIHHIKSYKDFPHFTLSIDNGICLCEECHRNVHKKAVIQKI